MIPRRAADVRVGEDTITYDVCGVPTGGPPWLLLHGSGGNRASWTPLVPLLATDRQVVVVDVRGHGRSTDLAHSLGIAAVAADLEAVAVAEGIESWVPVGHSLGGYFALGHAALSPARCPAAVSIGSLGGVMTPEALAHLQEFARLAAEWAPADALDESTSFSAAFRAAHPEAVYLHHLLRALNPPLELDTPAARMQQMTVEASALAMPVLFLAAEHDPFAPADVLRSCAAAPPQGRFGLIAGAGHVSFWEAPEAVAAALADFAP